jgi:hypothetical protein
MKIRPLLIVRSRSSHRNVTMPIEDLGFMQ